MIPILYRPDEFFFLSNGLGRLVECTECTVTEERNGIFELEFKYPITGRFYQYMIDEGGVVAVIHDDKHDIQPFDIYSYSAPIDGIVTFNAHHISYRLANIIVSPFTAESCAIAFDDLKSYSVNKNLFTFWTNKATAGTFTLSHPDNIRALLGGKQGSILDVYGTGEYEFDKYNVRLYLNRGVDSGVTIRYGKNLTSIDRKYSEESLFNAVAPYWADAEGNVVMLPELIVISPEAPLTLAPWTSDNGDYITDDNGEIIYFQYVDIQPQALDLSSEFQEQPTPDELREKALQYMANNQPWTPNDNITVDFTQLWQTPEYEDVASLQRVSLCDTVSIYYPELGVTQANAKIIRVVYNVLLERYDSMEVGTPKTSLADYIRGDVAAAIREDPEFTGWQAAIAHATEMITGGLGGYVVMNSNADGQPQEILIMDTADITTAVHVIRMNRNGIGFSNNGYSGPYESAWTIDGQFNADFIATGTILANFIKGGTLLLGGAGNGNGVLSLQDSLGEEIVLLNNNGIEITRGTLSLSFQVAGGQRSLTKIDPSLGLQSFMYGSEDATTPELYASIWGGLITLKGTDILDSHETFTNITSTGIQVKNGTNASAIIPEYVAQMNTTISSAAMSVSYTPSGSLYPTKLTRMTTDGITTFGDLTVSGTKNRLVDTGQFSKRLLYCYETPSPLFGDVGEGVIDETGLCYVFLDPVFAETITTNQYQVFLQRYGQGDCFVSERKPDYFVVHGEPGLSFGWELKAKQKDFDQLRLEREQEEPEHGRDYGSEGTAFYINLQEGRIAE